MTTELSKDDLRRFARLGAMKRLDDIRREEAAIRQTFPELFAGATAAAAPKSGTARKASKASKAGKAGKAGKASKAAPAKARKRSTMSAAMRKEVSERMKKYWAARRKAKNG